jgi:hypothetical protein
MTRDDLMRRFVVGFAVLCACPAAAGDEKSAAVFPSIELDMGELVGVVEPPRQYDDGEMAGVGCAASSSPANPHCRSRGTGPGQSNEDYVKTCQARQAGVDSCPLPKASAYDHHQGDVPVQERVYLVNDDGKAQTVPVLSQAVNFSLRSEWVIKYDAVDGSGNEAQQLVFAIILNDITPPALHLGDLDGPLRLEACDIDNPGEVFANAQYWQLPARPTALDAYDGDVSDTLSVDVTGPGPTAKMDRPAPGGQTAMLMYVPVRAMSLANRGT